MGISVFKPFINRKDMDSVLNCLVSEKLESGVISKQLASDISGYIGIEEGWLLKEYRRAVEAVFRAVGTCSGDTVLLTPLAPYVYRLAAADAGLVIKYVDIDPDTACISAKGLADAVEAGREQIHSAVIDSPFGFVPDVELISDAGITLIEDISNSFGASASDRHTGSFGNYTVMNLDPDKIITAGSGTFIAGTGKKEKETLKNILAGYGSDIYLSDINSAVAINQVAGIEKVLQAREEIAQIYIQAVMKTRNRAFSQKNDFRNAFSMFPVMAESSTREIKKYAAKKGVDVAEAFEQGVMEGIENCPEAKNLSLRCILFPLYPNIGKGNAEKVVKIISTLP